MLALLAGTLPLLAGPAVRAERAQAAAQGDGDAPAVAVVLARAAAYVDAYQRDFAMMVAQERYQQEARYPGPVMGRGQQDLTTRTVLVSDFLLVRSVTGGWVPFRDVFERDGVAVRDRNERLSALFLEGGAGSTELARRISEESARYNVGNVNRNINLPTLALLFLTDAYRERFTFTDRGHDGRGVRVLQYREDRRPTYISTTGGRDLPATGRFWIDEATGRVERSELLAEDPDVDARITVTYRPDEAAGLWVPERMDELYKQRADRSEIRGTAVYSRFRQFQVKTTEDVAN